MVPADVLVSGPSIPLGDAADPAIEKSHGQSELLPSPPESSTKPEEKNFHAAAHLPSDASPANTPDLSPASGAASTEAGSGRLRKKVDFSPWTASTGVTSSDVSIRSLPPSRECQSSKSILKPGRPSLPSQEDVPERIDGLATMLDTILQQLGSADRQIRHDAYFAFCSAIKAYAELPDGNITKGKIHALLAFIKTDLIRQSGEGMELVETNLVIQVLKLLVVLVWNKAFSVYLTDSYQCFLIDHSTQMLEDRKMPKTIILHHLHLLSTQEFSSRAMTTGRAVRLLETLKDLSDNVRGNGVVLERLMVYQRILQQAKTAFKSRPLCWVSRLLTGMTSSVHETRKKAINLGHRAAIVLGSSPTVATALRNSLDTSRDQEGVLSSVTCKRLVKMLKSVDEARQVPQIWAVVMLLMRGLEQKLDEWQHLHDWLKIMQRCFNCRDAEVRVETNKAWNKLAYVARPHEGPKSFLTKMLMKPILAQLDRPSSEKQSKSTRNAAFAAYCNLLYYALKPSASASHYDAVWDEYLVSTFKPPFLSSEQNSDRACRILSALFWRETVSPWRENRALDASFVEPEELPLLDCKWIRSHTRSILEAFKLLFRFSCWGPAAYPDNAYVAMAWRSFARALGDACRKEVIPSPETSASVTHLSRFLKQVCQTGTAAVKGPESKFIFRVHFICKTVLLELGPVFFTEGALVKAMDGRSTAQNTKASPKGRPSIVDLLESFLSLPENCRDGPVLDVIIDLLQLTRTSRLTPQGRIHLYSQCSAVVLLDGTRRPQSRPIWTAISKLTHEEMVAIGAKSSLESVNMEDIAAEVERILACGIPYQQGEGEAWSALLKQALLLVHGFAPSGMMIFERLATCLGNQISTPGSICTVILVQAFLTVLQSSTPTAVCTTNSKATRRQLETVLSGYRQVVSLLGLHLSRMYDLEELPDEAALCRVVELTISLLQTGPSEYTLVCLAEMQDSLALWLEDERRFLTSSSRAGSAKVGQAQKLCPIVIDVLGKLSKDIDLRSLDRLFAAGFKSTQTITINQMVKMWDSNYGATSGLQYGHMLTGALAGLTPFRDPELPELNDFNSHKSSSLPTDQLECLGEYERGLIEGSAEALEIVQLKTLPAVDNVLQQEYPGPTHEAETNLTKKDLQARVRHDDSQVHFVSIESSPLPGEDNQPRNLTARQKEVRERQNRETALLFPDLRPSPTRKNEASRPVEAALNLVPAGPPHGFLDSGSGDTPTLPSRQSVDYIEASRLSPTPKSKQQALRLEDIEIASSPLSVSGLADSDHQIPKTPPLEYEVDLGAAAADSPQLQETAGDMAVDSSPEAHNLYPPNLEDTRNSTANFLAMEGCLGQIHAEQISSHHAGKAIADAAEEPEAAESQARNDSGLGKVLTHVSLVDNSDEVVVPQGTRRDLVQIPQGAGPSSKVPGVTPGETRLEVAPQIDGGAETHSERSFATLTNEGTVAEEQLPVHSDDNGFWSASQLSQDLERAASSAFSPSPIEALSQSVSASAAGKRKPSSEARRGSKRRKATAEVGEVSQVLFPTPALRASQVVYDCIKVDSSSSPPQADRGASASSQALESAQPAKRGRGRPRKSPANSQTPTTTARKSFDEVNDNSQGPELTVNDDVCLLSKGDGWQDVSSMSSGLAELPGPATRSMRYMVSAARAVNKDPAGPCDGTEMEGDEKENRVPPEQAVELLHKALSSLRRTTMGRSELRAIDDLVFEIRTEAQNAAQRRRKNCT